MNFLAHAYLSQGQSGIITGNLISDFVKGNQQYQLPELVQKGIRLHRAIDRFTDGHAYTQRVKSLFKDDYGLYAGAFADIVFDYFLANDPQRFQNETDLHSLTDFAHQDLENHISILPEKFLPVYQSMRQYNWLALFGKDESMRKSFESLVRRAAYMDNADRAYAIFLRHKSTIIEVYEGFFPQLEAFSIQILNEWMRED